MTFGRELPKTISEALRTAEQLLSTNTGLVKKGVVATEAEQAVQAALKKSEGRSLSRAELLLNGNAPFSQAAGEKLIVIALGRAEGRLLQHLTGFQRFLDHDYAVGPDVLVPRPETEVLVVHAIEKLRAAKMPPTLGLEIGLGSGVMSIELLAAFPSLWMVASEFSDAAKIRAAANAREILKDTSKLRIISAQDPDEVWLPFDLELRGKKADFIMSNPPYLTGGGEVHEEVLRYEPKEALFAPEGDPGYFYRAIAEDGRRYLAPGGFAIVEIPHERAGLIETLFTMNGWKTNVIPDLSGRPRVVVAE